MPFAAITHAPGDPAEHVGAVLAALGGAVPAGLLAYVIGEADHEMQFVEVWQTQAQHDRFVVERLHPALRRVVHRLDDRMGHLTFEVSELYLGPPPIVPNVSMRPL